MCLGEGRIGVDVAHAQRQCDITSLCVDTRNINSTKYEHIHTPTHTSACTRQYYIIINPISSVPSPFSAYQTYTHTHTPLVDGPNVYKGYNTHTYTHILYTKYTHIYNSRYKYMCIFHMNACVSVFVWNFDSVLHTS